MAPPGPSRYSIMFRDPLDYFVRVDAKKIRIFLRDRQRGGRDHREQSKK